MQPVPREPLSGLKVKALGALYDACVEGDISISTAATWHSGLVTRGEVDIAEHSVHMYEAIRIILDSGDDSAAVRLERLREFLTSDDILTNHELIKAMLEQQQQASTSMTAVTTIATDGHVP